MFSSAYSIPTFLDPPLYLFLLFLIKWILLTYLGLYLYFSIVSTDGYYISSITKFVLSDVVLNGVQNSSIEEEYTVGYANNEISLSTAAFYYEIQLDANGGTVYVTYNSVGQTTAADSVVLYAQYNSDSLFYKHGDQYKQVTSIVVEKAGYTVSGIVIDGTKVVSVTTTGDTDETRETKLNQYLEDLKKHVDAEGLKIIDNIEEME